jgi:hypothetical protein
MNSFLRALSAAVIPLLLLISSSFIQEHRGPFFFMPSVDPDYVYLFSGVSLINGIAPVHRDHPGATIQALAAAGLKTSFPNTSPDEVNRSILKDPEAQLLKLSRLLLLVCAVLIGVSGYIMSQHFGSVWLGMLYQIIPFLNYTATQYWGRFNPDPAVLAMGMLFLAIAVSKHRRMEWPLGVVFGFMLATKITSFFLVVFPIVFLWKQWRRLAIFAGVAFASLAAWLIPVYGSNSIRELWKWAWNLAIHSQKYGYGNVGLPPISYIGENFFYIIGQNLNMSVPIVLGALVLFKFAQTRDRRLQIGTCLAVAIAQVLAVSKHPSHHYLFPALGVAAYLLLEPVSRWKSRPWFPPVTVISILAGFGLMFYWVAQWPSSEKRLQDLARVNQVIEQNSCRVIYCYGASSIDFAVMFGAGFTQAPVGPLISDMYPNALVYDVNGHQFIGVRGGRKAPTKDELKASGRPICLQCVKSNIALSEADFKNHRELIETSYGDTVYRVELK